MMYDTNRQKNDNIANLQPCRLARQLVPLPLETHASLDDVLIRIKVAHRTDKQRWNLDKADDTTQMIK